MKIYKSLIFSFILLFFFSCKEEKPTPEVAKKVEIREWKPEDTRSLTGLTVKRGLKEKTELATPGYVMFQPTESTMETTADLQRSPHDRVRFSKLLAGEASGGSLE